jgi:hypothetical protein
MGANQDANWCVSYPWFDWILRTRERTPESAMQPEPARAPQPVGVTSTAEAEYEPEAAE